MNSGKRWRPFAWTVLLLAIALCDACHEEVKTIVPEPPSAPRKDGGERERKTGFEVPDKTTRTDAVGDLSSLKPELQRVFVEDAELFVPIPEPGPHDWLANHKERGQTFEAYAKSGANPVEAPRTKLTIQPIGDFAKHPTAPRLDDLVTYMGIYFAMETRAKPTVDVDKIYARTRVNSYTGKRQMRSIDVLNWLYRQVNHDTYASVALTMIDLYPEESWNFVFGQAYLSKRAGVYSFARYDPAFYGEARGEDVETLVLRRALKVMVHETGHMFGMEHCVHFSCVMNGSNHLDESDSREIHLCPVCLRKLHHAVGFDPVDRYQKLADYYKSHKLEPELRWTEKRLAKLPRENGAIRALEAR